MESDHDKLERALSVIRCINEQLYTEDGNERTDVNGADFLQEVTRILEVGGFGPNNECIHIVDVHGVIDVPEGDETSFGCNCKRCGCVGEFHFTGDVARVKWED